MNTIIEAKGLSKVYRGKAEDTIALKSIDLTVKAGESLAIIGKSGSGKSTLMHSLATLDRPTSGSLTINGTRTEKLSLAQLDKLRNAQFGFVFQQFFVNPRNTCLENVALPLVIMGISPKERTKKAMAMLEAVGLADKAKNRAND
ncbi:MAG: transporter ATP-binding protein, partial [Patescibacteria group bacterium]|nr:transporter ATP-binding protein [Patescibacteria group bacterium]